MSSASRSATGGLVAAAALGVGAVAWGALVERNSFTVREETLPVLAPGARPLTVLHLSDLHMAPWQAAKQEWVRSLAVLEPDLIVNTGDNLGHADGIDGIEYALEPFRGVPGVFVNGSNDYFGPQAKNPFTYFSGPSSRPRRPSTLDTGRLESFFTDLGWLDLNNTARAMTIRGSNLEFVGVNDPHLGYDRLDRIPGALDDLRENVGWRDDASASEVVSIGVTHAPYQRVLNSLVTNGADVIFAGHTHGGQVCVPGYGALVTNCDIPREQASGLSLWHHARRAAYLSVSAGLGTSIYAPVRFACKPEAVLLTLTGDDFSYSG
ncbi:metallophosphoesterase [Marisediminicola senii]|uniref:metallophosphoesterase n=1 Tax=Marisediminicola senii TaxID=2711233 RepID=UPI0013EE3189|nr:metallophosphoesterase [Marisediminicola senii]